MTIVSAGETVEQGCKTVRPLWKIVSQLSIKLNIHLSYDPATYFWVFFLEK